MVTSDEVRIEVEGRLGRHIPERIWSLSGDREVVERIQTANGIEQKRLLDDLIEDVRAQVDYVLAASEELQGSPIHITGEESPSQSEPSPTATVESVATGFRRGSYEHNRARVFSEQVAEAIEEWGRYDPDIDHVPMSDQRSDVQAFRTDMLGGVLDEERARDFVRSPAARALWVHPFEPGEVPLTSLRVEVESEKCWRSPDRTRNEQLRLRISPPGAWLAGDWIERTRFTPPGKPFPSMKLPVGEQGRYTSVGYWQLSVLDRLHKLAKRLSRYFPWSEEDLAWFVVTGTPPLLPPLRGSYNAAFGRPWERAVITLEIEPWISAATVERLYSELRSRVLPFEQRRDKALAVWLFARDKERETGRPLRGSALLNAWNDAHPDDQYTSREAIFRARERGEAFVVSIVSPGYRPGIGSDVLDPHGFDRISTPVSTPKPANNDGSPRTG